MAAAKAPSQQPAVEVDETRPKVFAFVVPGGKTVRLGSLSLGTLAGIGERCRDPKIGALSPITLVQAPFAYAGAAEELFRACCDEAGVTAPTRLDFQSTYDALVFVNVDAEVPTSADQSTT